MYRGKYSTVKQQEQRENSSHHVKYIDYPVKPVIIKEFKNLDNSDAMKEFHQQQKFETQFFLELSAKLF